MQKYLLTLLACVLFVDIGLAVKVPYVPADDGIHYGFGSSLMRINDGDVGTGGAADYQVHPTNAMGKTITMTFATPTAVSASLFYNRATNPCCVDRIDGAKMIFKNATGSALYTHTFASSTGVVSIVPSSGNLTGVKSVELTNFQGNYQNFREIEFYGNLAPVDISLSHTGVDHNAPVGTVVGSLAAVDVDTTDTHTYSFACDVAGVDDSVFSLSGLVLSITEVADYDSKSHYAICIRATDSGTPRLSYDKQFTIDVGLPPLQKLLINEVGYDPVGLEPHGEWFELYNTTTGSINLSGWSIVDNSENPYVFLSGSIAPGDFYLIANDTSTFHINHPGISPDLNLPGVGRFRLSNTNDYLRLYDLYGREVDYVQRGSISPRILDAVDGPICRMHYPDTDTVADWSDECTATPGATNTTNKYPTNITLSSNSIPENTTVVGNFSTIDADAGDMHTYTLVAGTGSDDNGRFALTNTGGLSFSSAPDFENPSDTDSNNTYTIRVRTTDNGSPNFSFEKVFTIAVTDVNEAPTITDKTFSIAENASNNMTVGVMTGSDVDVGDTLSYSIVAGNTGSVFAIDDTTGQIKVSDNTNLDYETTTSYTLTIQASDAGGLTDTAIATITITDVDEVAPTCGTWSYSPITPANSNVTATLTGSTDNAGGSGIATAGGTCTLSSNTDTCTVSISDNADNTTVCTSANVSNIDTTKPTITVTAPTKTHSGSIMDTTIHITDNAGILTGAISATGGTITCTQTSPTQVDCAATIATSGNLHVTATDQAGNTENKVENAYIIDTIQPTCGSWTLSPITATTGSVIATLSGSTDTGGAGITITGGTCTITTNNTTCSIDIVDNVGNTQTCTSPTATNIDRVAPTITAVSDKSFAEGGAITPIGITTDDASAVIVVSGLPAGLTYDATTKQIAGTPTTPHTPTGATVTITATDALGNSSTETFVITITSVATSVATPATTSEVVRGASGRGTSRNHTPQQSNTSASTHSTSALDGLLNPDFVTQCVTPIDKPIIDQKNNVTQQFKHAQQLIYSYGLTQYRGTRDYGPERQITREEAARFFTEFTTNILCRKPSYTYNQNFTDLDDADPTLHDYIRTSFEYGIFQGDAGDAAAGLATTFRPKDLLSYDELAAVLVRLVTNEYNESYDANRPVRYRSFLQQYASVRIETISRDNVARVIYDLYRNNSYDFQDVGYVIKK